MELIFDPIFESICACGEPGWACKCCHKCGSTDKRKTCACNNDIDYDEYDDDFADYDDIENPEN